MNNIAKELNFSLESAQFVAGAAELASLPALSYPEICLCGRSNVGKSSLINALTKQRDLAHASKEPGRTRQANLFKLTFRIENRKQNLVLCDLPGFGYAKLAKTEREILAKLSVDIVTKRENVKLVCILNDSKRLPEQDELALREVAFNSGKHVMVVATKCDRLSKKELSQATKNISQAYGLESADLILAGSGFDTKIFWKRALMAVGF